MATAAQGVVVNTGEDVPRPSFATNVPACLEELEGLYL